MPVENPARLEEIKRQRFEEALTLDEIATLYNISRERVRQLLGGETGGYIKTRRMIENERVIQNGADKTNTELRAELGITATTLSRYGRPDQVHAFEPGSNLDKHYQATRKVAALLDEHRIHAQIQPMNAGFNIMANWNKRIVVRTTSVNLHAPSLRTISPTWCFNLIGDFEVDFFALVITKTMDLFIVPANYLIGKITIAFCWPSTRPEMSKVSYYHNNFDILRQ